MLEGDNAYLEATVNPLIEALVTELLREKPADPVPTMIRFLTQGIAKPSSSLQLPIEKLLDSLRFTNQSTEDEDEELLSPTSTVGLLSPSHSPNHILSYLSRGPRESVSAASTGEVLRRFTSDEGMAGVKQKSVSQVQRALAVLRHSSFLASLPAETLDPLVSKMEELEVDLGTSLNLSASPVLFIEEGEFDCEKNCGGRVEHSKILPGQVLSEMTVMYNCVCEIVRLTALSERNVVWSIERDFFEYFLRNAAIQTRKRRLELLLRVPLLAALPSDDLLKVCDGLKAKRFLQGEVVAREDTLGNTFYLIESGMCAELTGLGADTLSPSDSIVSKRSLAAGEYFDELALLRDEPRSSRIVADSSEAVILFIDRKAFKRLLGPIEGVLMRNVRPIQCPV